MTSESPVLLFFFFFDLLVTIGAAWSIWTLRSPEATKQRKIGAVVCLGGTGAIVLICTLINPEFILGMLIAAAIFLCYYALMNHAGKMWK